MEENKNKVSKSPVPSPVPILSWKKSIQPPWIPPPAKTSKNLRSGMDDNYWNLEEAHLARNRRYEAKIAHLLKQLENLQDEKMFQKNRDLLEESRNALRRQSHELDALKDALHVSQCEVSILRHRLDEMLHCSSEDALTNNVNDSLIHALIDTELSAQSALLSMKRSGCGGGGAVVPPAGPGGAVTVEHRVREFDQSVEKLCTLLRNRASRAMDAMRWKKQYDDCFQKMTDLEEINKHWQRQMTEQEKVTREMQTRMQQQRAEENSVQTLHLEDSKRHLKELLDKKQNDCEELRFQLHEERSKISEQSVEVDRLRHQMEHLKVSAAEADNCRHLQLRLNRQQDRLSQLEDALKDREEIIHNLQDQLVEMEKSAVEKKHELNKMDDEKTVLLSQLAALKRQSSLLESENERKSETLQRSLTDSSAEFLMLQDENQRLRLLVSQCDNRLADVDAEMTQLRLNLRKYENLAQDFRSNEQINQQRWKDQVERSQSQIRQAETVCEDLQRRLSLLESHNKELSNKLTATEAELRNANVNVDDLKRHQLEKNSKTVRPPMVESVGTDSFNYRSLEGEIHRLRAELSRLNFEKEEDDRKHHCRVQDLRGELEQAQISSRSLNAYVSFLKRSYANVFGQQVQLPLSFIDPIVSRASPEKHRDSLLSVYGTPSLSPV